MAELRRVPQAPVVIFFILILFPLHFDIGSVFMTGTRLLILVMFIPMCMRLATGQLGRILPTDILLLVFAIWIILTLLVNSPDQAISFGGSVGLEVFGGYMIGRAYVRTADDFAGMCQSLFWVIICTLPFAVYESQTGVALIPETISKLPFFYSVPDFFNELAGIRLGLERSQVIFSHPIHYGLFCSTAVTLAFVGFKGVVSNLWRFLFLGAALTGVFFSLSSGAILPVLFQIGLVSWAWVLAPVQKKWVILGGLTVLAYIVVDVLSNRTPIQVFLSYATLDVQTAVWRQLIFEWGMKNVWDNPFAGIGLNDWERAWFMKTSSMDNYWLLTTVRYGIPGFLLVTTGFLIALARVALRNVGVNGPIWQFRRAWAITLASLMITLCTVDAWATAQAYVFFIFGSGMWILSAQPVAATDPKGEASQILHPQARPALRVPQPTAGPVYSRFDPTHKRTDAQQK